MVREKIVNNFLRQNYNWSATWERAQRHFDKRWKQPE